MLTTNKLAYEFATYLRDSYSHFQNLDSLGYFSLAVVEVVVVGLHHFLQHSRENKQENKHKINIQLQNMMVINEKGI